MKTKNCLPRNPLILLALIAALNLIPAGRVAAQMDGVSPYAGLILSGNTLYGTAITGGSAGHGTVFAVNTDGTGFTNLHNFTGGSDGAGPQAGLILSSNTLYGTAAGGGSFGWGTVFAINTDGTGFTNLHTFAGSGGDYPYAGLVLSGNVLYGTTQRGGTGDGTVFAVNTGGTGFTILHTFTATPGATNSDGAFPYASLVLSSNTLYGTAYSGGSSGNGTVFKVNADGTGFTNLHSFTGSDGANPYAGLIFSGSTLYGTASGGGSSGKGAVFALNTDGTGLTNLHSFTATDTNGVNSDGANPYAGLILSGNTLYGTASGGGSSGGGTVFAVNTDGTGFTNLHNFTATHAHEGSDDGGYPHAGLILSGNTLYGTATYGGISDRGMVFAVNTDGTGFVNVHSFQAAALMAPQLTISLAVTNVLLMWPSTFEWIPGLGGFSTYRLQSAPSLGPSAVWTDAPPGPIVVNGQKIVASPISGTQQFYRLIRWTGYYLICASNADCPCGECFSARPNLHYCAYADGSPCDH